MNKSKTILNDNTKTEYDICNNCNEQCVTNENGLCVTCDYEAYMEWYNKQ